MNLCELLVALHESHPPVSVDEERTKRALSRSRVSFQTAMLLFYFRHGFETEDCIMTHFLSTLAHISLVKLANKDHLAPGEAEETRSTLNLAAEGLSTQGQYYYLTRLVSLVLQGEMNPEDLTMMRQVVMEWENDASARHMRVRHHHIQYPISIDAIGAFPGVRRLGSLIDQYTKVVLDNARATPEKSSVSRKANDIF